jgi:hypothetical protein
VGVPDSGAIGVSGRQPGTPPSSLCRQPLVPTHRQPRLHAPDESWPCRHALSSHQGFETVPDSDTTSQSVFLQRQANCTRGPPETCEVLRL